MTVRRPLGGADEKEELSVPAFLSQAVPGGEGPKSSDKASKEAHRLLGQEQAAWLSSAAAWSHPQTPGRTSFLSEREAGKWGCELRAILAPALLQAGQTLQPPAG